jgi:uncharacterized protein (DUF2147 family)
VSFRSFAVLSVIAWLAAGGQGPACASEIAGRWERADGVARVNVAPCGASLCMTNFWIKPGSDEKVGEYLAFDVKPSASGVLSGSGYDPQRGLRFSVEIAFNAERMTTKGCLVGGLVCRESAWTRLR